MGVQPHSIKIMPRCAHPVATATQVMGMCVAHFGVEERGCERKEIKKRATPVITLMMAVA